LRTMAPRSVGLVQITGGDEAPRPLRRRMVCLINQLIVCFC
jgi:hypothetical protein